MRLKKRIKKFLAEFLCVALIACSMPGMAFAAEDNNTGKGSVTADYDTDGQKDTSGTGTKESADTGTDEKDSSGTNEQSKGEGNTKDSDGTTDTDGESTEGKNEDSGTETKGSDSGKTDSESEDDNDEESADTEQNTSAAEDDESDGESTEDSAEDDAEDDAGSDEDTDMDSDDVDDNIDAEDDIDTDTNEAENEDEAKSDANNETKGASEVSDEDEEEEDGEEEDWIDGLLDDDLMLLTASPSDAILPLDELIDGVWQIEGEDETYPTFAEALDAAQDGDTIILLDDIKENITVTSGSVVTLDLNDYTLSAEDKKVSVVNIEGGAELTLMDSGDDGCITGADSSYGSGGGVYNAGIFNMDSGSITENYRDYGGGVYNTGTFNMNGGLISANNAFYDGGGVYNSGIFNMTDGEICGNEATSGAGGVNLYDNATFTMSGGTISGNGGGHGGGVCINANATFIMEAGKISENNGIEGGGVCIGNYGTFTMSGGEISGNSVYSYGYYGDGVVLSPRSTFNLSGAPIITDNATSNVYLYSGAYITLTGDLEDGAPIGVTPSTVPTEITPVQITTVEDGTSYYQASAQYFYYDVDSSYVGTPNETGQYVELAKEHVASLTQNGTTTEYTSVQAAVNAAGTAEGTVTMLADSTENVTITGGQDITLDLAGFTIDGNKASSVITNRGTLTLVDSVGSGCITNGSDDSGGAVYNAGTFNMDSGTIKECYADQGGGVFNEGNFTMNGGTISDNTASRSGGGIRNVDTFTMNGGTISGNSALFGGGISSYGDVTIYDGIICNNSVSNTGGAIYNDRIFTIYGGTITDNYAMAGGGVFNCGQLNMQWGKIYDNTASSEAADIYSDTRENRSSLAIIDAVTMLGNEDSDQCYKWYNDKPSDRYSLENITDVYDDENVINAESPYEIESNVYLIAAGDEGHIYSEENVAFDWDGTDSCTAKFTCMDCGHEETVTCDVTYETVTEPTCTDVGSATYIAAATIISRDGELTVTDEQTEEIKALGHEWVVEQTVIEDFEDRYEEMVGIKCRRCGLEYEEEIVVSTESSGVTAHSTLSWSDILTEDDLAELFESGAELDFKMTAAALAESDVPSEDRTLAEDLIAVQWPDADYTASWLDISVLLDIIHSSGEEETREYNSTLNPVTITVAIPDELLNADGDTYAVIRIHDGEAEVLDTTDNGDGTLTFESDLFSTYVIVKTAEADSGNGGTGSGGGSRRSNSSNGRSSGTSGSGISGAGASLAYSTGTWTIDEYGHWRYTDSNGRRYENEWGYIYNPYADTSAGQPSASWFHFGYDGIMDTGWYIDPDGKMYYLNPSLDNTQGAMFTGWVFIDGKWYYFDTSGALLRSTQTPDGYMVDETGARVEY